MPTPKDTRDDIRPFGGGSNSWGAKLIYNAQKAKQLVGGAYDKKKAEFDAARQARALKLQEAKSQQDAMADDPAQEAELLASLEAEHNAASASPDDSDHGRSATNSPTKAAKWKDKLKQAATDAEKFAREKTAAAKAWQSEKECAYKVFVAWKKEPSEVTREAVHNLLLNGELYSSVHKLAGSRFLDEKSIREIIANPIQDPESEADATLREQIREAAMWQRFYVWLDKRLCFNDIYGGDLNLYIKEQKLGFEKFICPNPLLPHHQHAFSSAIAATFKRDRDALAREHQADSVGLYGIGIRNTFDEIIGLSPNLDALLFATINNPECLPIISTGCYGKLRKLIETHMVEMLNLRSREELLIKLANMGKHHHALLKEKTVTWRVLMEAIEASDKIAQPFRNIPIARALSFGDVWVDYDFIAKHDELLAQKTSFERAAGKHAAAKSKLQTRLQAAQTTLKQAEIAWGDTTLVDELTVFNPVAMLQTSDKSLLDTEERITQQMHALNARIHAIELKAKSVHQAVKEQGKLISTYQGKLHTLHVLYQAVRSKAEQLKYRVDSIDHAEEEFNTLYEKLSQKHAVLTKEDIENNCNTLQAALDRYTRQLMEAEQLQRAIAERAIQISARRGITLRFSFTLAKDHCGYKSLTLEQLNAIATWHQEGEDFNAQSYNKSVQAFILESPQAMALKAKYTAWKTKLEKDREQHDENSAAYKVHTKFIGKCDQATEANDLAAYIAKKVHGQKFQRHRNKYQTELNDAIRDDEEIAKVTQTEVADFLAHAETNGQTTEAKLIQLAQTDDHYNQESVRLVMEAIQNAQAEIAEEQRLEKEAASARQAAEAAEQQRLLDEAQAKRKLEEQVAERLRLEAEQRERLKIEADEKRREAEEARRQQSIEREATLSAQLTHEVNSLEEHPASVKGMLKALTTPDMAEVKARKEPAEASHKAEKQIAERWRLENAERERLEKEAAEKRAAEEASEHRADGREHAAHPGHIPRALETIDEAEEEEVDAQEDGNNDPSIAPKPGEGGADAILEKIAHSANKASPSRSVRNTLPAEPNSRQYNHANPIKWWYFLSRFLRWWRSLFATPKVDEPMASDNKVNADTPKTWVRVYSPSLEGDPRITGCYVGSAAQVFPQDHTIAPSP